MICIKGNVESTVFIERLKSAAIPYCGESKYSIVLIHESDWIANRVDGAIGTPDLVIFFNQTYDGHPKRSSISIDGIPQDKIWECRTMDLLDNIASLDYYLKRVEKDKWQPHEWLMKTNLANALAILSIAYLLGDETTRNKLIGIEDVDKNKLEFISTNSLVKDEEGWFNSLYNEVGKKYKSWDEIRDKLIDDLPSFRINIERIFKIESLNEKINKYAEFYSHAFPPGIIKLTP